jgi:hypothetical protein
MGHATGTGDFTFTVTEAGALVPPEPVQVTVYTIVALGCTVTVWLVPVGPIQAVPTPFTVCEETPPDEHCVAFVLDHVSVDDCPAVIVVGFAEIVTVGTGTVGAELQIVSLQPLDSATLWPP